MYPFFELTIDENDDTGVSANALVDYPAHMKNFVAFGAKGSPKTIHFDAEAEGEQRIVLGVMISAGTPIYRMADESAPEHYVIFKKETIAKIHRKFHKNNLGFTINEMHDPSKMVEGVYMEQSYLIGGEKNPKVPEVFKNLNLQDGTWIATYRIENDEVWKKVKNGEFQGFSVEGLFNRAEVKVRTKGEFKIAAGKFGSVAKVEKWDVAIDQEESTIEEGTLLTQTYEYENGETETYKLNDGEYTLPDGRRILVDSEGKVRTIFKSNKKMKKTGFFASLAKEIGLDFKAKKENFVEATTVEGVVIMWEGELGEGTPVFVEVDGEQSPAPEGPHQVELDGVNYIVTLDVNGVVESVEEVTEDDMENDDEFSAQFASFVKSLDKKYNDRFEAQEKVIANLGNENEQLKKQIKEMEDFQKSEFNYTPRKTNNGKNKKTFTDFL